MNLDQIDALIRDWQEKLRLATDNILEITDLITYKRLVGETGFDPVPLEGVTAARVAPALEAIRELWQGLPLLNDVVNKAAALRKNVNRLFPSADPLKEIERLLTEPSVELPPLTNALARRTLLTPAQADRFVAPEQLLAAMTRGFELSKVILEVDAAWSRLDSSFAAAAAQIQSLQQQAQSLRIGPVPELDQLKDLHRRCEENWQHCLEDIDHPVPQPRQDPAVMDRLEAWLATLQSNFAKGYVVPVNKGLNNWLKVADGFRDTEERAAAAYRSMGDERLELRGMLAVLKRRAQKRRVVEDPELLQLEEEAAAASPAAAAVPSAAGAPGRSPSIKTVRSTISVRSTRKRWELRWQQQQYIGSRQVEKLNDRLVVRRQKNHGVHWNLVTSEALARLKALQLNHEWDAYWAEGQLPSLVAA